MLCSWSVNTLKPRPNGRHFADDIFKWIFSTKNVWIPIKISLKFFPQGPINNIPALVQIMAWRRPGDKPLSEPMNDVLFTDAYMRHSASVHTTFLWSFDCWCILKQFVYFVKMSSTFLLEGPIIEIVDSEKTYIATETRPLLSAWW